MTRSLARTVAVTTVVVGLLLIGANATMLWNITALRGAVANFGESLQRVELSGSVNAGFFHTLMQTFNYAHTRDGRARAEVIQELAVVAKETDQLGSTEVGGTTPYDNDAAFADLQARRKAIVTSYRPTVMRAIASIDAGDDASTTSTLSSLQTHIVSIGQLEADTATTVRTTVAGLSGAVAGSLQSVELSAAAAMLLTILITPLAYLGVQRGVVRPVTDLADAAREIGRGCYREVPVTAHNEIGHLQEAFNQMVRQLAEAQAQLAEEKQTLEARVAERTHDLELALGKLQAMVGEREQLLGTVRELASPVIPVQEGVLVMPLVGSIDTTRMSAMKEAMLTAVERHRARVVILDVTGVPIIDTAVARTLLQVGAAAQLIGARTMLVGIRPELAQTIVGLGLDLSSIETYADLQTGVQAAARRLQRA